MTPDPTCQADGAALPADAPEEAARPRENCAFCRIVAGSAPADILLADERMIAFLDVAPLNPGQALLIPRRHHPAFTAMPPGLAGELFTAANRLAVAIMRAGGYDGYNLLVACGPCAGQIITHAHIHILPRGPTDGLCLPPHTTPFADDAERLAFVAAVRRRLSP
ncbi:MAG: HIT-like protein [Lentisphaerae bacterium ADurb.BinA184]|nr:MAG: HIT-like protein [Lentisphaerae bacterium ADurb.BinA184]